MSPIHNFPDFWEYSYDFLCLFFCVVHAKQKQLVLHPVLHLYYTVKISSAGKVGGGSWEMVGR